MSLRVLAPTWLEYLAVRASRIGVPVSHCGIGLRRLRDMPAEDSLIVCGLAGSLNQSVQSGSVFIPDLVVNEDGGSVTCDPQLVLRLQDACRNLGLSFHAGTLLTADRIVTSEERAALGNQGSNAVDMETGRLPSNKRIATIRVILDTADRPISGEWEQGLRTSLKPRLWPELLRLAVAAPRYSWRAARILKRAIEIV